MRARSAKSRAIIGGRGRVGSSRSRGPSSAVAAGGGEEFREDVFWISASVAGCILALDAAISKGGGLSWAVPMGFPKY